LIYGESETRSKSSDPILLDFVGREIDAVRKRKRLFSGTVPPRHVGFKSSKDEVALDSVAEVPAANKTVRIKPVNRRRAKRVTRARFAP